ncbi:MAG: threonine--tRNA ligase [Clostridia bacterium]|nr:threonine--tRNA ligase [Clostridia bacterium]
MNITLKDGQSIEMEEGQSCGQAAKKVSDALSKAAVAAKVNGKLVDLATVLKDGDRLEIVTLEDKEGLDVYRHTCAHVLAQAIKNIYPTCHLAIGPTIENGFYYDIDFNSPITQDDFDKIESEMRKIIKSRTKLERFVLPRDKALELMKKYDEPYKVELINDLPEDEVISFYKQGSFTDLCRGPHLPNTGKIVPSAFKLTSIAGAYWRGSEKNKMLTRIYGVAFAKKEEMDEYFRIMEEAKKRDHIKLGKDLKIFALMNEGKGFPFFLPNGMVIKNTLTEYWRNLHRQEGYVEIQTPIILTRSLWENSGHWEHYKDNMYTTKIDGEDHAVKPMNCPGCMLVYKLEPHSYKELPLRIAEMGLVHRHEKSGQLHGLFRVRCFTQDDAHIFMLPEQITDEIKGVVRLADTIYKQFGFEYKVELSTRPENSMGTQEEWDMATDALKQALDEMGLEYQINEGDGAFYGPKIDFHLKDAIGRTWQCGTIQLDFQMPQRFDLEYTGEDGQKHRPIMIHRALFGSIERFIGILIEHYAGKFPVWLAPVQAKILTLTDRAEDYANAICKQYKDAGIRCEVDARNEKLGYKIREAKLEKVPYILVVGDKEVEDGTVNINQRDVDAKQTSSVDDFQARILKEIADKTVF